MLKPFASTARSTVWFDLCADAVSLFVASLRIHAAHRRAPFDGTTALNQTPPRHVLRGFCEW
jgi:hypothetical protein